ncbi:uncharacterized protein [Antedon mediterranea]|uniref:uncharacterized protein n=1 Tax=Antedon mediterranea TaxID=105859 RepID=UPI003AF6DC97
MAFSKMILHSWLVLLLCVACNLHTSGADTVDVFVGSAWKQTMGLCKGSHYQVFAGDFNGDGSQDVLCHNTKTGSKEIYYSRSDGSLIAERAWKKYMQWCYHNGAQLFVGDFNGDGRTDMLCHDSRGYKKVSLAQPGGVFLGTSWERNVGWCLDDGDILVADFNADGRDDMLCQRNRDGYKWISYANQDGSFSGTNWYRDMGWCTGTNGHLFTGDFNGDRRADLLCHDHNNGYKWVALATTSGTFTTTSWEGNLGWCYHRGAEIFIGDFNKDKRDDMICTDGAGKKWIAYSGVDGSFTGTDWKREMNWCTSGNKFLIADVNGDGGDDMVCHIPSNGYKYIAFNQTP